MTNNQVTLKLDDCRRLTGKNLLSDHPGAIIDSFVSGIDKDLVVDSWQKFTRVFLSLVGWEDQHIYHRIFEDGITLAISAPVDGLYSACELIEESWAYTCEHLAEGSEYAKSFKNFMQSCEHLKAEIANEANPLLLTLIEHADQHNINYLIDDDEFSLGYGTYSQAWPIHQLPQPNSINWQRYKSIPVAYVTGTNGKSTSVRIISKMFSEAGYCAGSTSTDFIKVGNEILDYGDYSGPSGARMLLRHPKTEIAILEVARGGILRRGLPVDCVDSALITNVAEDHLG
ncbi:MAG TPA: Mur ligase, partial [Psychromonas hadalis]|nr:Mur ligase [Psychromonas hadalis]